MNDKPSIIFTDKRNYDRAMELMENTKGSKPVVIFTEERDGQHYALPITYVPISNKRFSEMLNIIFSNYYDTFGRDKAIEVMPEGEQLSGEMLSIMVKELHQDWKKHLHSNCAME